MGIRLALHQVMKNEVHRAAQVYCKVRAPFHITASKVKKERKTHQRLWLYPYCSCIICQQKLSSRLLQLQVESFLPSSDTLNYHPSLPPFVMLSRKSSISEKSSGGGRENCRNSPVYGCLNLKKADWLNQTLSY